MRRLVLPALLLVAAYFSVRFLHTTYLKYHAANPESFGLFLGRQGWLFTHLAGGALTLVLGPLQLLRQRLPSVRPMHRWSGRLYLLGMLVACTGAAGLIITSPAPGEIRMAFAATMLAWLVTASVAMHAIFGKRVPTHRNWMIRNYLVALAPVTFRLMLPIAPALGFTPSPALIAALLWASWMLPLLAFELLARMPDIRLLQRAATETAARGG